MCVAGWGVVRGGNYSERMGRAGGLQKTDTRARGVKGRALPRPSRALHLSLSAKAAPMRGPPPPTWQLCSGTPSDIFLYALGLRQSVTWRAEGAGRERASERGEAGKGGGRVGEGGYEADGGEEKRGVKESGVHRERGEGGESEGRRQGQVTATASSRLQPLPQDKTSAATALLYTWLRFTVIGVCWVRTEDWECSARPAAEYGSSTAPGMAALGAMRTGLEMGATGTEKRLGVAAACVGTTAAKPPAAAADTALVLGLTTSTASTSLLPFLNDRRLPMLFAEEPRMNF